MAPGAPDLARADDLDRRTTVIGLALILAVVGALRLLPLLAHDWALGDGGLFFIMIGDLIAAGFALPEVTSFQGGIIPFAYPPLAFYLAAALEELLGLARLDVLRLVPWLLTVASVATMYLLAAEVGPTRRHALLAAAFFGSLTGLNVVLSSGGGLTRSAGLLLALLATWAGMRMLRSGRTRDIVMTALLSGLAVLAHPQAGPFLAIALAAAWLTRWRTRQALGRLAFAATGAFLLISPWIVTVVARYGLDPFRSAAAVPGRDPGDSLLAYLFLFLLTAPAIGLLDLLGQVQQALARRPQLLLWRMGVFGLDLRFSPISGAAPTSMLAAHGVLDVLVPAAWRLAGRGGRELSDARRRRWRGGVVLLALLAGFVPSVVGMLGASGPSGALSPSQREAMAWVRDATSPGTVTVTIATSAWGSDNVSEWFPALSQRASATTTQGLEWTGELRAEAQDAEAELRSCHPTSVDTAACLKDWVARHAGAGNAVVYLDRSAFAGDRFEAVAAELVEEHGYRQVWSSDQGVLLQPPPPPASSQP